LVQCFFIVGRVLPRFKIVRMDKTVGEHIRELETRRQQLRDETMKDGLSLVRKNDIDSDIRAIDLAISYFRAALETKQQVMS
jgi:hypothetical protein